MEQNLQPSTPPVAQQPPPPASQTISPLSKKYMLLGAVIFVILLVLSIIFVMQSPTTSTPTPSSQSDKVAPLTQEQLDEWSKKLASGSVTQVRSVLVIPANQSLDSDEVGKLVSAGPFKFKLSTFKQTSSNKATIEIDAGLSPPNSAIAYLVIVNGKWKIIDMQPVLEE